jgi:allophanate hydrolase subunit 1
MSSRQKVGASVRRRICCARGCAPVKVVKIPAHYNTELGPDLAVVVVLGGCHIESSARTRPL